MNTATGTPKKRGRPPIVKLIKPPNKRGRPRKEIDKLFTEDVSSEDLNKLSIKISKRLKIPKGELSDTLALKAISFCAMEQVHYNAPKKNKTKGGRSKIHLAALIYDCALVHEKTSGEDAKATLKKIGGWAEDLSGTHKILEHAEAVLSVLEVEHASLRRQVRRAIDLFE